MANVRRLRELKSIGGGCVEGLLANVVTLGQELCGSFPNCAGKSVLNYCLQAFHLRRVDAVEKGIAVIELGKNN